MTALLPSPGHADAYRDDGFVVLPGFFDAGEVAVWLSECDRLAASGVVHPDNIRTHVLNSERAPDRLDPVVDLSPALRRLATGTRLLGVARALLGEEARLFKDKLILKPPGDRGYLAHQDYAYWHRLPAPPASLITIVVALDPATVDNGALELFAGLHHRLLTDPGVPADVPESALPAAGKLVEANPGDVVAFHSLAPHRSGDNRTDRPRRQLFLSYCAASHGDLYRTYYDQLHQSVRRQMAPDARARAYFG